MDVKVLPTLRIFDESGAEVAREGQRLEIGGGASPVHVDRIPDHPQEAEGLRVTPTDHAPKVAAASDATAGMNQMRGRCSPTRR